MSNFKQLLEVEHSLQYRTAAITRRGLRCDVGETKRQIEILDEGILAASSRLDDIGIPRNVDTNEGREILAEYFDGLGVNPGYSEKSVQNYIDKNEMIPEGDDLAHCMKVGGDDLRLAVVEADEEAKTMVNDLIFVRQAEKFKTAYLLAFLDSASVDGRVHATIRTMAARTHRMSISDPPLQQIPSHPFEVILADNVFLLDIRNCLIADDNCVLIGADYSQIEQRVIATLAGEQSMIEGIQKGLDFHKVVARDMFLVPYEEVTPEQREIAKTAGYLMIYGGGAKKLALSADIPLSQAQDTIKLFRSTFKAINAYSRGLQALPEIVTPFGRVLPIDPIRKYAATNYMIQSTARDLFVIGGMRLIEAGYGDYLWLPIHDEWIMNVPEKKADEIAEHMSLLMSLQFYSTPIDAEGQVLGPAWRKG